MGEDSPVGAILVGAGIFALGLGVGGLTAEALRPRERLQETVEELCEKPLLPRLRPLQTIKCCVDNGRPMTVLEAVASAEPAHDDPRVQMERFRGVCDNAEVRKKEGVTPGGHTGDLVTGLRCVIDYEERRKGGPIRL